jgi:hypothetical protein
MPVVFRRAATSVWRPCLPRPLRHHYGRQDLRRANKNDNGGEHVSVSEWEVPDVAASELSYAVTSSVLEQFAQGHTVGDVLRELVQNEYDALAARSQSPSAKKGLRCMATDV